MTLPVTQIQRFCVHDGPGIRTTIFLKGCPLRCAWCHNPETQEERPQILYTENLCIHCGACAAVCPSGAQTMTAEGHRFQAAACVGCLACTKVCPSTAIEGVGQRMTPEELLQEVLKDRAFYGEQGGLTLSGGEPLLHMEGCLKLLRLAKEAGLHTAVETCGFFDSRRLPELVEVTDLFLWDYKDSNAARHQLYTGVRPEKIWENLKEADRLGAAIRLRCILVQGVNTEEAHYQAILKQAQGLVHCEGIELLPYHAFGGSKNKRLGYEDNGRRDWIPSKEEMQAAKNVVDKFRPVYYNE